MSEPVIVSVTFVPADGARDEVISALEGGISEVHSERGCELYSLHEIPDGTLFMIENWTSVADLDAHAAGETVARLDASLEGLLAEAAVVTLIVPHPAGTRSQGQL